MDIINFNSNDKSLSNVLGFTIPDEIPFNNCFFAYENANVVAIAYHDFGVYPEFDSIEIFINVRKEFRRRGIGRKMYKALIESLDINRFDILSGCVWEGKGDDAAYEFCRSLNAEDWQELYYMEYEGLPFDTTIQMVPYKDEYYTDLARNKFEAWKNLAQNYGFKISPYSNRDRETWLNDCKNSFVYMLDNEPVAMGSCGTDGHMHGLFVAPKWKGRGLGTEIVKYCTNRAIERGFHTVSLSVLSRNPAIEIYKSLGFKTTCSEHYFRFSKHDN